MRSRTLRGGGRAARRGERAPKLAEALVWALILLPPLLVVPTLADAFDRPKLMLSELLGLASLLPLGWRLARSGGPDPARLLRLPAFRAVAPALAVATAGLAFTPHFAHAREGLVDLWIGAACLVGWSAGLGPDRLRRLLAGLTLPASVLALLAALQFHGLYRPFAFAGGVETERLGVTSLAGNTGVLADYLALGALIAQWLLYRAWNGRWGGGRRRLAIAAAAIALGLCLYGLATTQTVTGLAALGAGSAVLWLVVLPRRRALTALAAVAVLALAAVTVVAPLRQRVSSTVAQIAVGDWGKALRGRTDGWKAGLWMASRRPLTGVGHGAYGAEFADAKLALSGRGVEFLAGQRQPTFADAHDEFIQVAAEWGLPGVAALAWGLWLLLAAVRRRFAAAASAEGGAPEDGSPEDGALAVAGTLALAMLAAGHFPFRVALVGYPALLLLAWILAPRPAAGGGGGVTRRLAGWALVALVALALAGLGVRAQRRLEASRILRRVEQVSVALAGKVPAGFYWANVEQLERARRLDPTDSRLPLAAGSQYLLLGRPEEAIATYREALALEPRPEIYLNLGRAQAIAGDPEAARESFRRAVVLSPRMRRMVPAAYSEGGSRP